ncbi:hypothetical protein Tco_1259428 [Tanacetum coccineum]
MWEILNIKHRSHDTHERKEAAAPHIKLIRMTLTRIEDRNHGAAFLTSDTGSKRVPIHILLCYEGKTVQQFIAKPEGFDPIHVMRPKYHDTDTSGLALEIIRNSRIILSRGCTRYKLSSILRNTLRLSALHATPEAAY